MLALSFMYTLSTQIIHDINVFLHARVYVWLTRLGCEGSNRLEVLFMI